MLTRDLILCRSRGNKLFPSFVNPDEQELLSLAEQLLAVFRQGQGQTQGDLGDILSQLLAEFTPLTLGKGLRKILEDRCEFSAPAEVDYPAERQTVLTVSARLWQERSWVNLQDFQVALRQAVGPDNHLLGKTSLYADLPDNDTLLTFKDMSARQLLERYNVGLVQALLLNAKSLQLSLASPEPAKLRRLCKYLRFFRLLCRIQADSPGAGRRQAKSSGLRLLIDGPGSIFQNSRSYGLQLASFFPAICTLENWQLTAEVSWRNNPQLLVLDQSSGLVCHYRNYGAYIPEEIKLFERHFAETVPDWKIIEYTQYLRGEENEIIFPDCSFENAEGKIVHLELFHRWHRHCLTRRLQWLEKHPSAPILLGVDRALQRGDPEIEQQLQNSQWFAQHGFLFRDYPTVKKTLKGLQTLAAENKDSIIAKKSR